MSTLVTFNVYFVFVFETGAHESQAGLKLAEDELKS